MTDLICRTDDEYVRDRMRWVVSLSNGETVYADDDRPGLPPGLESAWVRLKAYCRENRLWIVAMRIQFRSNSVELPGNEAGYYFSKSVFGVWGEESHEAYIAGVLKGGDAHVGRWTVPELTLLSTEVRPVDATNNPCLIASFSA